MTSKQRAYLKGLAMTMDPILQLGKGGLTPENTAAVEEALAARELIKISVLQNCLEDPREMAQVLAERTRSQVVQVIGKKIVLYREGKKDKKKIILPFMRWISAGHEQNFIKLKLFIGFFSQDQMPHMNGIKSTTHDSYFFCCFAHL